MIFDFNLFINVCDKLIFCLDVVKGMLEDVVGNLRWVEMGNKFKVENFFLFYMNLVFVIVGGKFIIGFEYVFFFVDKILNMSGSVYGDIEWRVIIDFGGESYLFYYVFK